ncbi:MAG: ATP-binding cassette domain-containing protein, partial [Planctomycetota bacterium]
PLYTEMTPAGLLAYAGSARGMRGPGLRARLDYVAETCALGDVWRKPIGKLSRGYRQRVGMAQALLHDPEVLILDEPTGGLDPNQVHGVRDLIAKLRETKTVLLSTHILREVRAMCDRVVLVSKGRVVFDGPVDEMESAGGDGDGDETPMERRFRELTVGTD